VIVVIFSMAFYGEKRWTDEMLFHGKKPSYKNFPHPAERRIGEMEVIKAKVFRKTG